MIMNVGEATVTVGLSLILAHLEDVEFVCLVCHWDEEKLL